jgi:endonuclease V-like protein UPF0215 family
MSTPSLLETVAVSRVRVDGNDSTDVIVRMVRASPAAQGAHVLLVDGITMGGFNILDLGRLTRALALPVIALTRRPPDLEKVRSALAKYFPKDFRSRWNRVRRYPLFRVPTGGEPLWAAAVGCTRADAAALVQRSALRGYWPEPLRVAHAVAHAIGTSVPRSV